MFRFRDMQAILSDFDEMKIGALPPLLTEFSRYCETIFFSKKEKHTKNGENHMKERKESF